MSMPADLRHSLRLLRRSPGFSAVAVLVLALGIGANVGIFSIVNTLVLQPRPGRIDSLVGVFSRDATKPDSYRDFSYPAYVDLRGRTDVFDALMAHTFSTIGVRDGDLTRQAFATFVSANYFETLGVTLAAGRPFTLDEERRAPDVPVAIASYAAWSRRSFDPAFVGSTVRLNGIDVTIVGVAPRGFAGVMAFVSPQWWLPLGAYDAVVNETFRESALGLADRRTYAVGLAGALKPGVSREAAERALAGVARQLGEAYPASDRDRAFVVAPLPRVTISSRPQTDGPLAAVSALLMFMAGLVLTVACLNIATLLLARGVARRREIAIRQAVGGSRWRIVQQLLVEGLTLSVIGGGFGVVIGWWASSAIAAWLARAVTFGIDIVAQPNGRLIAAAAVFVVLSTLVFALAPAWSASRLDLTADLKSEPARVGRRFRTGSVLVAAQLAVSLALVAAGGLFTRGAVNAAAIDAGFPMAHQLVVGVDPTLAGYQPAQTRALYRAALERVRALPGVERASFASTVAFGDIQTGGTVKTTAADQGVSALYDIVGAEYFATLGVPVLRGREFTRAEEQAQTGPAFAVIDAGLAARLFRDGDAIGRTVQLQMRQAEAPQTYTVVGVVPALRHDFFESAPQPHLYIPYGARFNSNMIVHVRTSPAAPEATMLSTVRKALLDVDPRLPILSARTMTMHRDASISAWMLHAAAAVFTAFGMLALLLAAIGMYGLKAYDTERRTREIGIRMALGATARDVQRLIVGESGRMMIGGLAVGVALALGIGKLASGLLFRVSPFDPLVLSVASVALAGTALLAGYVPARRATRVPPSDALRTE